jgi:hypothetical protein
LYDYLDENYFIIINRIYDIANEKMKVVFYDNYIIDEFISTCKSDFKKLVFDNMIIYTIRRNLMKKHEYFEEFVEKVMDDNFLLSIDVYDLIDLINRDYSFDFNYDTFVIYFESSRKIYFSEELEKVFVRKKYYYDEVYKNGK